MHRQQHLTCTAPGQSRRQLAAMKRFETQAQARTRPAKGKPRPIPGIDAPYRDGSRPKPPKPQEERRAGLPEVPTQR